MASAPSPSTPDLAALAAATLTGFERAAAQVGEHVEHLQIAGVHLRVRLAGQALTDSLLPALSRCRMDGVEATDAPAATFHAWESRTSGIPAPRPPWSIDDYLPRDEIRGSGADGIDVSYALATRILSVWDRSPSRGVFWVDDAAALPTWEPNAPFRNLLHWALADRGLVLAHAAVVGTPAGGVLLAGRGGAGKSTTSLVCVDAGWRYVSDDYCVLATEGPPTAHALYGIGKLSPGMLERLPGLAPAAMYQRDDGKVVLDLSVGRPEQLTSSLPLRAVVVPRIGTATGRLTRLPPSAGARALAPSTLFQLPGARPGTLGAIAAAIGGLPVYGLEVGPDLPAIPAALLPAIDGLVP